MTFTRTTTRIIIKFAIISMVSAFIVIYAIWRSLNYTRGPSIITFSPTDGIATTSATIRITGRAERISDISMNGERISVDESGNFQETLILFSGINIITFAAYDRFGRTVQKQIRIVNNTPRF